MHRTIVPADAHWEESVGYCRAVRVGNNIYVSGTSGSGTGGVALHPEDPGAQARDALARIERALEQVGAGLGNVVRTRIFLVHAGDWVAVGRVHREVFKDFLPASTMVEVAALLDPSLLVEIEADAIVE